MEDGAIPGKEVLILFGIRKAQINWTGISTYENSDTSTKASKSVHRKHPDYNPPLTPPPNSPIPLPSPSPEDRQGRIVDRVSEILPKSHGSSPKSPPSRWTQLFQENSPQSETPSLSTPGVVLQRRSASPVIRPAKIIYRQR
ncbi:hypothetical protein ABEW05_006780 [Botrytis cinerea]